LMAFKIMRSDLSIITIFKCHTDVEFENILENKVTRHIKTSSHTSV